MQMNDTDRCPYALADQPRTGLDIEGIRCAMPLMPTLSINGVCRASIYVYNTPDEIDMLVDSLGEGARVRPALPRRSNPHGTPEARDAERLAYHH
jgi:hypothetical protein